MWKVCTQHTSTVCYVLYTPLQCVVYCTHLYSVEGMYFTHLYSVLCTVHTSTVWKVCTQHTSAVCCVLYTPLQCAVYCTHLYSVLCAVCTLQHTVCGGPQISTIVRYSYSWYSVRWWRGPLGCPVCISSIDAHTTNLLRLAF